MKKVKPSFGSVAISVLLVFGLVAYSVKVDYRGGAMASILLSIYVVEGRIRRDFFE